MRVPHTKEGACEWITACACRRNDTLVSRSGKLIALELAQDFRWAERRVNGQAKVSARSLHVAGDGEGSANDGLAVDSRRSPSKAHARLESGAAICTFVKTTITVLAGERNCSQERAVRSK